MLIRNPHQIQPSKIVVCRENTVASGYSTKDSIISLCSLHYSRNINGTVLVVYCTVAVSRTVLVGSLHVHEWIYWELQYFTTVKESSTFKQNKKEEVRLLLIRERGPHLI